MTCPSCQSANDAGATACGRCGAPLVLPVIGPGFVLASRYEIGTPLGKGGMGMVFRAHDRLLAETVAIKVLRPDVDDGVELGQRFIGELKLARAVSHRNVCRIHEYGEDRGLRYISMAYVDGVDLKKHLRQKGSVPVDDAFRLCIAIAEGLDAIHEEGIVHRDLKPQNVMLDTKGQPRLMDFGIAKQADATSGFTETGRIVGTPEYMSPEQVKGLKLDRRSDIYALGILVHEVFTGTAPFHADTPVALLMKHLQEPPELFTSRLPPALVPVLQRALEKDREKRYPTAREMARALEQARATTAATTPTLQETNDLSVPPAATGTVGGLPRGKTATTYLPVATAVPPPTEVVPRGRRLWPAALGGLALAGALGFLVLRPREVETPVTVATMPPAPTTTMAVEVRTTPTPEPPPVTAPAAVADARPAPPPRPAVTTPAATPQPAATPDPRIGDLLRKAEAELLARRYDAAVALYDQVLALDPRNGPATDLRTAAVKAQVAAQSATAAPAVAAPSGRLLVSGQTVAHAPDAGRDKAFDEGFEATNDMEVTRDSTTAALPGRLTFQVEPERVRGGDTYEIKVALQNTGLAPIEVSGVTVTNARDGRRVSSAVPPLVRAVAPRQTAVLLVVKDVWPDVVKTWSWEVVVRTARGETYRNQLQAR